MYDELMIFRDKYLCKSKQDMNTFVLKIPFRPQGLEFSNPNLIHFYIISNLSHMGTSCTIMFYKTVGIFVDLDILKFYIFYCLQSSAPAAKRAKANPQVYFDIKVGGKDIGRITAQLRADVVPMTAGRSCSKTTKLYYVGQ